MGPDEFRAWVAARDDFLPCMIRLVFLPKRRITISTLIPFVFLTTKKQKKRVSRSIFVGKKWLEVGYNPKDVWSISRLHAIHSEREDHPTQKPLEIVERMIKASCPANGIVLDPFMGSGTTAVAAHRLKRNFIGFEINSDYCEMIRQRLHDEGAFKLEAPVQIPESEKAKSKRAKPSLFEHALNLKHA